MVSILENEMERKERKEEEVVSHFLKSPVPARPVPDGQPDISDRFHMPCPTIHPHVKPSKNSVKGKAPKW